MKTKKWLYISAVAILLVIAILLFSLHMELPTTDNDPPATTTAVTTVGSASSTSTATTTTTTTNTETVETTTTTTLSSRSNITVSTTKTKATKVTTIKTTKTTTGEKSYLDLSKLTGTQEDVGKVVGYNSLFKKEVTVVSVTEGVDNSGLKYIETVFSDGTGSCVIECEHCHEFPCPNGGGEACSEYDVKLDATKTCQQCGLPKGDGHNGTCFGTIDWDNGGVKICHHYD